jgi:hypothetical protein
MCFVVRKTISELEHAILTTLFLLVQKALTRGMLKDRNNHVTTANNYMLPHGWWCVMFDVMVDMATDMTIELWWI